MLDIENLLQTENTMYAEPIDCVKTGFPQRLENLENLEKWQ